MGKIIYTCAALLILSIVGCKVRSEALAKIITHRSYDSESLTSITLSDENYIWICSSRLWTDLILKDGVVRISYLNDPKVEFKYQVGVVHYIDGEGEVHTVSGSVTRDQIEEWSLEERSIEIEKVCEMLRETVGD